MTNWTQTNWTHTKRNGPKTNWTQTTWTQTNWTWTTLPIAWATLIMAWTTFNMVSQHFFWHFGFAVGQRIPPPRKRKSETSRKNVAGRLTIINFNVCSHNGQP